MHGTMRFVWMDLIRFLNGQVMAISKFCNHRWEYYHLSVSLLILTVIIGINILYVRVFIE